MSLLAPSFEQVAAWIVSIEEALPAVDPASRDALAALVAYAMQQQTTAQTLIRRVEQLERTRLMVVRSANP